MPHPVRILLLVLLLAACNRQPDSISPLPGDVVTNAAQAFVDGYNNDDLSSFDAYFATPQQGADPSGILQTLDAARKTLADAPGDDPLFELQSFEITSHEIDAQTGEATVHYRAQVSVTEHDAESAVFAAFVEQNVALIVVDGRWLISGGDTPVITPVGDS